MPIRKSTPTNGLEIILNLKPLDLKIEESALNQFLRVLPHNRSIWDGLGKTSVGHLKWGRDLLKTAGVVNLSFDRSNDLNLYQRFKVDLDSFRSGLPTSDSEVGRLDMGLVSPKALK